jgi:hypothetical protein
MYTFLFKIRIYSVNHETFYRPVNHETFYRPVNHETCGFGGLGVSALAFGTKVLGFNPGRSRRIFQGEKILSAPSFGSEVKP